MYDKNLCHAIIVNKQVSQEHSVLEHQDKLANLSLNGSNGKPSEALDVEQAVRERYGAAAQAAEPALCCPVDYDTKYLEIIPEEIIERDYGCGDPSKHLVEGDTVLDLGSGGGKICYIAAQVVGAAGKVIGVDRNDDMLALARKYQTPVADKLGYANVDFRKGSIQDLALNLESFEAYLAEHPVQSSSEWLRAEVHADTLRKSQPLVASDSVDVVVSNCVLNLVDKADRRQLFVEIFRVLKRGGRAVISDIVCDEPVPEYLQNDPNLWSGCISGAFVEDEFLQAFAAAGFYGIEILSRQEEAWATVEGIEFRSVTIRAYKGKEGACLDQKHAVIYNGPWSKVMDDDGHTLYRGKRMAVCGKTFEIYRREPYASHITPVPPNQPTPLDAAAEYDCHRNAVRHARETKGQDYDVTLLPNDCCGS
ncbi:MAG: methyltransferase domain-containing protein, partial [Pirellulales bacterium]|nr:methyltransferase domain-containing protein [Pirellulales bacterium]